MTLARKHMQTVRLPGRNGRSETFSEIATSHERMIRTILLLLVAAAAQGQASSGPANGHLILTGGDWVPLALERFVALAGGSRADLVYIPTAASELKLPSGFIYNPDSSRQTPAFEAELAKLFNVDKVTVFHTRDRNVANAEINLLTLANADGVWLGSGNSGRLVDAYLATALEKCLHDLLARGKVIGGNSAGAIIQGSFIVRGRADKPLLMPAGRTTGFGFLSNVVINPHVLSAKRENELVEVLDAHPELLGIGLDDSSAIVVTGNVFEVIGGRVAIYENVFKDGRWYYWMETGRKFDMKLRVVKL
jgi:cyanophycinase